MLYAKSVATLVFIWMCGALLGALFDRAYVGVDEQLTINSILFYDIVNKDGTLGTIEIVAGPLDYMAGLWDKATFQFSFFTAESELVRWFAFGALTAYFVFGMVMTVISILRGAI